MALWILLAGHFIGDFYLQSDKLARSKGESKSSLMKHAFIYAVVTAAALFPFTEGEYAFVPYLIIALSHLLIDYGKVSICKRNRSPLKEFVAFIIDQALHIGIITAVYLIYIEGRVKPFLSDFAEKFPLETGLRHILLLLIILEPVSVLISGLSAYISGETEKQSGDEPPVGSIIGKLERILTAVLVLSGEMGAIGFVLTAKSLARYKQLDDRDFAEKYLVGTLSSTAAAILTAICLK